MATMNTLALTRPLRLRSQGGHEAGRKVTWLELFFDLVFVAAVAQVGEPLLHDYSIAGLGRFALLFVLIWWAWHGHTTYATRFDTDDVLHRALTLLQMFAAAAMAVNAKGALDGVESAGFAAAYAVMRLLLVAQYVRARQVVESRRLTTIHSVGFGIAAMIWLTSALVPAPGRFVLWALALAVDVATPLFTNRQLIEAPPDAEHLPERFGLFTIILIGEAIVGVMHGMEQQSSWPVDAALSAFLGMATAFGIWWWYFDAAGATETRVIRSDAEARRFHIWSYAHLPLYLGIAVMGVGIHHVIAVADTGTRLHGLEAWILSGAVALAMCAMTVVSDACSPARSRPRRRQLAGHYGLAAVALAFGAAGPLVPCSVLVALLASTFAGQVVWSLGR